MATALSFASVDSPGPRDLSLPRGPRIDAPDVVHHVVARGIERRWIFVDDEDRLDLLERLSVVLPETAVECLAWALMDNHFHLVLRTHAAPLGHAMARVLTGYALHFNRRHARAGHLFQNRYYSRPVASHAELIAVIAYVHRNPLAAGVVASPEELKIHPWTGHAALMGNIDPWAFHTVGSALAVFGSSLLEARQSLEYWVTRSEPMPRDGDDAGAAQAPVQPRSKPRETPADVAALIDIVCRRLAIDREALACGRRSASVAAGRAVIAHLAARRGWSLPRLGPLLGVKPAGLYQALERGRQAVRERPELEDLE